jgi:hypothetical protein
MRTQPILKMTDGEEVKTMFLDESSGAVLVGTSQGRILAIRSLASNAYLMGERTIYATRINGRGEESATSGVNVRYGLVDKVVELASDMSVTRWKDVVSPAGAESYSTVSGVFTTPVLWAGEDFGWWGDASWTQTVGSDSRVVVAIRVASSEEAVLSAPWKSMEMTTSGLQSWSLDEFSIAGSYAQARVILSSGVASDIPVVSGFVLPYYAKHASYFFLTKITMEKGTSIRGGLLTASVSVPRNTEVKWGVAPNNTADWNTFTRITPDKLFELSETFGDRLKVGVKMITYDDERTPSIDEFSVVFDSNVDNLVNKG